MPFCYYIILAKNLDLVISYYLYVSLIWTIIISVPLSITCFKN